MGTELQVIDFSSAELADKSVCELIPEDTDTKTLLACAIRNAENVNTMESGKTVSAIVAGHTFSLICRRKDGVKEAGYDTIGALEKVILKKASIERATLRNYQKIAQVFPRLSPNQIINIGIVKLNKSARVAGKASEKQKDKLIEKATTLSSEHFIIWLENESGLCSLGDTSTASFNLIGTTSQIAELKEFLALPEVSIWADSDQPIGMVLKAFYESSSEWNKTN